MCARTFNACAMIAAFLSAAQTLFAAGGVYFDNLFLSTGKAPVTLANGEGPGPSWLAGLYLVQGDSLTLVATNRFRNDDAGPGATKFLEYNQVAVPGTLPGESARFRVRVWEASAGSYEHAVATGRCYGEFQTTSGDNEVFVPHLGNADPDAHPFPSFAELPGLLPLHLECLSGSFRITSAARAADGAITLTWGADPGATYNVLSSTDLAQPNWSTSGTVTASEELASFTDPAPAGTHRYYRIEKAP